MVTTGKRGEIESQVAEMTPAFDVDLDHEQDLEEGLLFNGEEWAQIERDLGPNPSRGAIWKWKEDREASGNLTAWSRHVADADRLCDEASVVRTAARDMAEAFGVEWKQ